MNIIIPFSEDTNQGPNNLPRSVIKVLDELGISPEDLPQPPKTLPERDIELLNNLCIHQDYAETLVATKSFEDEIISLSTSIKKEKENERD